MSRVVVVGSCNVDLIVEVAQLPTPGETVLGADAASPRRAARAPTRPSPPAGSAPTPPRRRRRRRPVRRHAPRTRSPTRTSTSRRCDHRRARQRHRARRRRHVTARTSSPSPRAPTGELTPATRLSQGPRPRPERRAAVQLEIPVATCLAAAGIARAAGAHVVLNARRSRLPQPADSPTCSSSPTSSSSTRAEALALWVRQPRPRNGSEWKRGRGKLRSTRDPGRRRDLGARARWRRSRPARTAVPAHPVKAVDTTGAGDAFCGAVATALAEQRALSTPSGSAARQAPCHHGDRRAGRRCRRPPTPTGSLDGGRRADARERNLARRPGPAPARPRHRDTAVIWPTPGCRCRAASRSSTWLGAAATRGCPTSSMPCWPNSSSRAHRWPRSCRTKRRGAVLARRSTPSRSMDLARGTQGRHRRRATPSSAPVTTPRSPTSSSHAGVPFG